MCTFKNRNFCINEFETLRLVVLASRFVLNNFETMLCVVRRGETVIDVIAIQRLKLAVFL